MSSRLAAMFAKAMAVLAIALVWGIQLPGDASAHAVLISSSPIQGEHFDTPPREFQLRFSEPVSHVVTTLVDSGGITSVVSNQTVGTEVWIVADVLANGVYALNWRVVSEDGHPVAASIVFGIGGDQEVRNIALTDDADGWRSALVWLVKSFYYAFTLFGIGGVLFACTIERRPPTRSHVFMLAGACLCAVTSIGLLGAELTGSPLSSISAPHVWTAALDSSLTRSVAATILALVFAAIASLGSGRRTPAIISLAIFGIATSLTGHASGAGIKWFSSIAVATHVMAAAFWAGALPRLSALLQGGGIGTRQALVRFSGAIPISIVALLAAGAYLACVQVADVSAMWQTQYGRVLAIKLVLVGTALAIGGYNRVFLTRPVLNGEGKATEWMRRLVTTEIALITLALTATGLWRFTPPPRSLALQVPISTSLHIHEASGMATVTFETTRALKFDAELFLQSVGFDEIDPKEVKFTMSSSEGGIASFDVPMVRVGPGIWHAEAIQVPCDCVWQVKVEALVSDFDLVTLNGNVRLLSGAPYSTAKQ